MKTIGLISATEKESGTIFGKLKQKGSENIYSGKIGANNIAGLISGIGKANAAHAATLLIERFSPHMIINFGIAGAYPSSGLKVGDIAIASVEIYGDEGLLLKSGFHTADFIGIPLLARGRKKYFNEFPLDKNIVKKAMRATGAGRKGCQVRSGAFVTVSTSTGTDKRARELESRFNAICENMEGAAVAHVSAIYGIPMLEIRGISNIVEDRNRSRWDIRRAAGNCQRALLGFLQLQDSALLSSGRIL